MKRLAILLTLFFTGFVQLQGQTELDDADIADAIEDQYLFDHAVNSNKVDVVVNNGIVELTGEVNNIKAKERATNIAQLVKGVRSVSNRIEVDPPVVLSDEEIENKVRSALLNDPATELYEIVVNVHDNIVAISGTVDSYQEKQLAANVAKSVQGVVGLENLLDIDYKESRSDYEIKNEIRAALKWNEEIEDGLIEIDVDEGKVNLSGAVGSAAEKYSALYDSYVSGVQSVDNTELEVQWWLKDDELRKYKNVDATDPDIEQAIYDAAIYDPRVNMFDITAEADNGLVTLRGDVNNLKAKKAAERLAENTYGVIGVNNRIKVKTPEVDDLVLEADIRESLRENAITEAWEINVFVNNGVATLTGLVDSNTEKLEAEWVASGVDGVNDVVNTLEVTYPYAYYWYGAYPYYDVYINRPADVNQVPVDELIKDKVSSNLWWSPFVDRNEIEITVDDGVVTLEGTVDSYWEYAEAVEKAWEGGAYVVENELTIK
jgi:osmotically-inducible protein OsmY